jgi:hypothetical protein
LDIAGESEFNGVVELEPASNKGLKTQPAQNINAVEVVVQPDGTSLKANSASVKMRSGLASISVDMDRSLRGVTAAALADFDLSTFYGSAPGLVVSPWPSKTPPRRHQGGNPVHPPADTRIERVQEYVEREDLSIFDTLSGRQ